MYVLLLNGSPKPNGNTAFALKEMEKVFHAEGIETDTLQVGGADIRGCIACGQCRRIGKCVFDDLVNQAAERFERCDGLVVGSPVYYAQPNGTISAFMQRLFYSTSFDKRMKVGACVTVARRGGLSATYDDLNKYFGISGMPIASGQYWNSIHGGAPGEAARDPEGVQGLHTLALNMAFLIKSIALGKEQLGMPEKERTVFTNFIR